MRVTRGFLRGWLKFPGSCHPSVLSGERGRHSNKTGSTVPSVISAMSEGEKRFMKDGNPCMTEKLTKLHPIAWLSWGCGFERCLQDSRQRVLLSHTGIEKQGIVNHSEEAAFLPLALQWKETLPQRRELGASRWGKDSDSSLLYGGFSHVHCPLAAAPNLSIGCFPRGLL